MREVDSRAKVASPSATFDCPDNATAKRLGDALLLWGASLVTIEGGTVKMECSMRFLYRLMAVAQSGLIEALQERKLTAVEIHEMHFVERLDTGEARG